MNEVYLHHSEPNNPIIGDSYYDHNNSSLSVYDGKQWNKVFYQEDLRNSFAELIRTDRQLKRIEKLNNIKKDYSNE